MDNTSITVSYFKYVNAIINFFSLVINLQYCVKMNSIHPTCNPTNCPHDYVYTYTKITSSRYADE